MGLVGAEELRDEVRLAMTIQLQVLEYAVDILYDK